MKHKSYNDAGLGSKRQQLARITDATSAIYASYFGKLDTSAEERMPEYALMMATAATNLPKAHARVSVAWPTIEERVGPDLERNPEMVGPYNLLKQFMQYRKQ